MSKYHGALCIAPDEHVSALHGEWVNVACVLRLFEGVVSLKSAIKCTPYYLPPTVIAANVPYKKTV